MLKAVLSHLNGDFLYLNTPRSYHQLSEAQIFFQQTGRNFMKENIKPFAHQYDNKSHIPIEKLREFGQSGLLSMMVGKEYGGLGADFISYCLALEEISYGCASLGTIMNINNSLYLWPVQKFGSLYQLEKYLKPFARGEKTGCFGLTEACSGSDGASLHTVSVLKNDQYILNGSKFWVSGCNTASAIIIFATADTSKKHKGISAFLVDVPSDGLTIGKNEEKLGIKGVYSSEVKLENCKVSKENLLGEEGNGFYIAMEALNRGRVGVAAQAIGIAKAALECAIQYSIKRKSFNAPISEFQATQFKLADMTTRVHASRLLLNEAAYLVNNNLPFVKEASMSKLFSSETATFVTHQAIQILGGIGYSTSMPAERYYRDARVTEIYGGTSEIQRLIVAKQLLKEFM